MPTEADATEMEHSMPTEADATELGHFVLTEAEVRDDETQYASNDFDRGAESDESSGKSLFTF